MIVNILLMNPRLITLGVKTYKWPSLCEWVHIFPEGTLQEIWLLATKIFATTKISSLISTHPRRHLIVVAKTPKQNYYCDDTYSRRYMSSQIGRRENFPRAGNEIGLLVLGSTSPTHTNPARIQPSRGLVCGLYGAEIFSIHTPIWD